GRPPESWASSLKLGQAFFSALAKPETGAAAVKGVQAVPEIFFKLAQTWGEGFFLLFQQWQQGMVRAGQPVQPYQFKGLDRDTFRAWMELYEQDLRPWLNLPQLGLTRVSQEKINQMVDRSIRFQSALADFLYLLYLPLEKSLLVMQAKLAEATQEGKLSEDFKVYYKMWIKILEGHYLIIFQSPEYLDALRQTVNALNDFSIAKQELLAEAFRTLPVPTHKDMDELYKELYLLKKQVKELARTVDQLRSQT
ncbi:MAG: poly(R)-hydroxyalkanoic acid synthase subunit PhaE, partial [Desulfobacca sp.]|nr:poly(R)-hydroxyalkanoic acid synthase subunit PhaE [Desulfobacca sp.]